jgi:tRNA:m4X modification enzyme
MKKIIYKGKAKEILECNPNKNLCEFFFISKMRYCKFEKLTNNEFCIYHIPKENEDENLNFIDCPIDPSHRVLASKINKHVKICNKLTEKQRLIQNEWYVENINKVKSNEEILKANGFNDEEYSNIVDKIIKCYDIVKGDYKKYCEEKKLEEFLKIKKMDSNFKNTIKESDLEYNFEFSLSGMEINIDKDLLNTKGLAKSEKNGKQNIAISNVIMKYNLLFSDNSDQTNVFIEFGAGKGGLSHHINKMTNNNSVHILLERDGVRYKKDRFTDKLFRVNKFINIIN